MGCTSSKSSTDSKEKRTAAERKAAWISVQQRLPVKKTAEDKQRRIDLFKKFDTNDTGSLTLSEVYNGCVNELELDQFTSRLYDIVKRSFDKSKSMGNREANAGSEDRVEFLEFRLMLTYIYNYFELWVMFDEIDTSGNMLIDEAEFKKAVPMLEQWGLTMKDPEAVYKTLDGNGSGTVTFDEFAAWATAMKLDADGDPDNL